MTTQTWMGAGHPDASRWALALVGERVGLFAQRDPHRRAGELEILAQRIHEIAQIGLRHGVGARAEQDETRRTRLGLGDVVQLQPAARYGGEREGFVCPLLEPL